MNFTIPNPVRLSFDPAVVIDDSEHESGVTIQEIFADDLARTFWLAIKATHLTNQYFRADCINVARLVRLHLKASDCDAFNGGTERDRLRGILACTQMFLLGRGVSEELLDELLPYMNGDKVLTFSIETENAMSYSETPCNERGEEHCEHYHDWPMAEDQTEPYGDSGDGLGVQGCCCECPTDQPELTAIMKE